MKFDYCLLAIDGDCSDHGMSDVADALPISDEYMPFVADFLKANLDWHLAFVADFLKANSAQDFISNSNSKPDARYETFSKAAFKLRDLGIFQHKWHCRTTWILVETESLENGFYGDKWQYAGYLMQKNVNEAYEALKALGVHVLHPRLEHGGHFAISGELYGDGSQGDKPELKLDYYENYTGENTPIPEILKEHGLHFEWINAGVAGVYSR